MSTDEFVPPVIFSDDSEGTDGDGNPTGLLMWGQAGSYNGVDDRAVISATADAGVGMVRGATLSAGSGLTINVHAGWLAIASCDDMTRAVVTARQNHTVTETAGGSAARDDLVWVDVAPDDGSWTMRVIPVGDEVGRSGISLGRIHVPAGANLATQMTFAEMVPTLGPASSAAAMPQVTNINLEPLTPMYPIPPWGLAQGTVYRTRAFGRGRFAAQSARDILFADSISHTKIRLPTGSARLASRDFSWEAECVVMIGHPPSSAIGVQQNFINVMTRAQASSLGGVNGTTLTESGVLVAHAAAASLGRWHDLGIMAQFSVTESGNSLTCWSSWHEVINPASEI